MFLFFFILIDYIGQMMTTKNSAHKVEEVDCPDNYAIKVESGDYIKCEDFDSYYSARKLKLTGEMAAFHINCKLSSNQQKRSYK